MSDLVEPRGETATESPEISESGADADTDAKLDSESVVAEIRNRAERVRRRELDAALGKLEAREEITPEQRRAVVELSAAIAGVLVEQWTGPLRDSAVDPEIALDLLTE
ncbi:hypothetical protein [Halorussus litoreus]|uniref:hypothetical protein n=1 Tax=Halorussus litoreus TaxID=1710536 RepID=UPI001300772F|nr:hypothetical protein [Halorussus litoreus]